MLFCQIKSGNNDVKMSQVFHEIAQFKHFTDLNVQCHSKLGSRCFTILFDGAYFLLQSYGRKELKVAG